VLSSFEEDDFKMELAALRIKDDLDVVYLQRYLENSISRKNNRKAEKKPPAMDAPAPVLNANNTCFNCGQPGHYSDACPRPRFPNPPRGRGRGFGPGFRGRGGRAPGRGRQGHAGMRRNVILGIYLMDPNAEESSPQGQPMDVDFFLMIRRPPRYRSDPTS